MQLRKQSDFTHVRCATILVTVAILLVIPGTNALASGPLEKPIYSFQGGSDGSLPGAGLIADKDGNLYGTTHGGGTAPCQCGTVFEMSPPSTPGGAWTQTQLYAFQGGANNDGEIPFGTLVFDKLGNLYGTTGYGGPGEAGTVFELSPPATAGGLWTETVLYIFPGDKSQGYSPIGRLSLDSAGNLYGTTEYGGAMGCGFGFGCGTVFELSPPATPGGAWTRTLLHEFSVTKGSPDGAYPNPDLAFDLSGALYGTTRLVGGGGTNGTIFQMKRHQGVWSLKTLYTFPDGINSPSGGVVMDKSGNLFGVSQGFRSTGGIYELTPPIGGHGPWTETNLYNFAGDKDGYAPGGMLLQDKDGNLYGSCSLGGERNHRTYDTNGTIFELSPPTIAGGAWTETTLHDFAPAGYGDGSGPSGGLIMVKGKLYGTTLFGGTGNQGTVFALVIVP